jgi:hypothetical protein
VGGGGSGAPSSRVAVLLSALAFAVASLALAAPGATATPFHPFVENFGSASQPSFTNPKGVAIYQATGDVYVMDDGSPASIKRYNPDGTPDPFSALGTNAIDGKEGPDATPEDEEGLGFGGPSESQVAVDNSGGPTDGDIYVTQRSPNVINIFSPTGAYLGRLSAAGTTEFSEACGVAVDPSGAVYVGDYGLGIHKFVPSANPPGNADNTATFTTTSSPCTLAAGAGATAGFLFPAQYNGPVSKIDSSTGELKYSFSEGVTTVSVDPASGNVYGVRGYAANGSELKEFDASGAASATELSTDALANEGRGIAVRGSTGHVFVSRWESAGLEVFGPLVHSPTLAIAPASGITATEATLHGTVNPEGVAVTECKFEYGLASEGGFSHSVPCEEAIPTDSGDHAVSAHISGLAGPASRYRFRLAAKNAEASSTSDFGSFRVGAAINGASASVGIEEATLRGAIVPSGGTTEYHFEWGTTSAYGNSTPAESIPAGEEPVAVSAELSGLDSGASYHFRLVAHNGVGTSDGEDQAFTTTAGPPHFPQRGFEIASHYPTGGVPVLGSFMPSSEDGNSIAVSSSNPLPNSKLLDFPDETKNGSVGGRIQNVFTRGADSWQRTEVGIGYQAWSADLQRLLALTSTEGVGSGYIYEDLRIGPDDQNESDDLYQLQPDGKLTWISRDPRIPVGTPQTDGKEVTFGSPIGPFTMSASGDTVVFKSKRQLLDADTTTGEPFRLYKWEDGQLGFIGVRPDGSVPAEGSFLGDRSTGVSSRYTVSRDGNRVVFGALRVDSGNGENGYAIYVQRDGEPTVEATKEEGVPPLPAPQPYSVTYRGAAADDSRVFFTSASRFTPNSGAAAKKEGAADLYAYDVATNKLRDLTPRLDGLEDPTIDPAAADQGRVLGVAANSEDGKRVYFVAEGAYPTAPNPEGELPQDSSRNLYMAELDEIDGPVKLRFIATLGEHDSGDWSPNWLAESGPHNENAGKTALVTPDGSVLGFASAENLTGQPLGDTDQLFVYDARSGKLDCASCPTNGTLPVASVNKHATFGGQTPSDWQWTSGVNHWMSSEGAAFFSAATPLVPADQNTVADIYEFREGKVRLVTTGTGTAGSLFAGASVDGSTVFFTSHEALAPQDKEPGIPKIYAARVGGGFPYTPPQPPCDFNAGACEGAQSPAPEVPGAGTAAFEGPGNSKRPSRRVCPKGKRKVRAKGKTRCVKDTRHDHRTAKHNRRASR